MKIMKLEIDLSHTRPGQCIVCGRQNVENSKSYFTNGYAITEDLDEAEEAFQDEGWMEVTVGDGCINKLV